MLSLAAAARATPPEFAPAVAAAERGDLAACRAEFEKIGAAATQHGLARRAFYGGAVCALRGGDLASAFALLERAIALEFHDQDRFYFDQRLQPMRVDPRWPALEQKFVAAHARWKESLNAELVKLATEDQSDRRPGAGEPDWKYVAARDSERAKRVREIVAAGGAKVPDDLYTAALVLLHGDTVVDLKLAHELARQAAEADADLPGARRLAASALDQELVQSGKPQKYGTQSVRKDGHWELAAVDPTVTDAERALWDVPPLAESRKRAEAMNEMGLAPETPALPPSAAKPPSKPPAEPPSR